MLVCLSVRSFVLLLFACLRAFFLFARAFVCSYVRLFVYLSFSFVLRNILVGNAYGAREKKPYL